MTEPTDLMRSFPASPETQVTIANMQEGPFNRWAFRNLRRMLPTANVWRGTGPVAVLDSAPLHLDDVTFEDQTGESLTVRGYLDNGFIDGFVVLHRGRIVFERYGEASRPTSRTC